MTSINHLNGGVIRWFTVWCLVVAVFSFIPAPSAARSLSESEGAIKEIEFKDLQSGLEQGKILLIDIRERDEIAKDGMIPGSHNLPAKKAKKALDLPDKTFFWSFGFFKITKEADNVVISCQSGVRAKELIDKLVPKGYKKLILYKGSFEDWVKNKGAVIKICQNKEEE